MDASERQIATDLNGIRKDHKARYDWAAERIHGQVVDAACGVGYGSWILAEAGCTVRRFDLNAEAVEYAKEHWSHENIEATYQADAMAVKFPDEGYDAVIAFEMLEHLEDPLAALLNFKRMAPRLLASVPNEAVWPHRGRYNLHYRHYTAREFEELLNKAGYEVQSWWGQDGKFGEPVENTQGRTLVVDAVAIETNEGVGSACPKCGEKLSEDKECPEHGSFARRDIKTETYRVLPSASPPPESVAIVAMGASKGTYAALLSNNGGNRHRIWDEVWAINAMGGVIHHDKLYHMDDIRVQEIRAEAAPESFISGMLEWMKTTDKPIITCKRYEDYPMSREYPLKEVLDEIGTPYLNTTVAYAVADAIRLGVKRLALYGCDFSYPNLHKREKGRGCVEFLLGIAASRGIHVELAQDSTLMDANEPSEHLMMIGEDRFAPAHLYGFDTEKLTISLSRENGWQVQREPREQIPTAQEMETKYRHVPEAA